MQEEKEGSLFSPTNSKPKCSGLRVAGGGCKGRRMGDCLRVFGRTKVPELFARGGWTEGVELGLGVHLRGERFRVVDPRDVEHVHLKRSS